jgi:hypothetical protein
MKVRLGEGEWYDFQGDRLLVKEARELEQATGMGLQDFSDGIRRGKIDALVFMLYLAQRRAGVACRFRDFDETNIADLQIEDDEDTAAPAEPGPEPDVSPLAAARDGRPPAEPPPPTPITRAARPRKKGGKATG